MQRLARLVSLALVVVLASSACGGGANRPGSDEWAGVWERALVSIPDLEGAQALDREGCDVVLERLRELQPELTPAPVARLDTVVEDWLRLAEKTFFECPPRSGERVGFEAAYEELTAIELEVDVVGLLESGGGS